MKRKFIYLLGALLLAACSSADLGSLGGLGDILGSRDESNPSAIRGTVVGVDSSARRIDLDVAYVNNLRDDRKGSSIYYDSDTVVEFGGRTYAPTSLERGDEIEARGANTSGRYVADKITVLRDISQ